MAWLNLLLLTGYILPLALAGCWTDATTDRFNAPLMLMNGDNCTQIGPLWTVGQSVNISWVTDMSPITLLWYPVNNVTSFQVLDGFENISGISWYSWTVNVSAWPSFQFTTEQNAFYFSVVSAVALQDNPQNLGDYSFHSLWFNVTQEPGTFADGPSTSVNIFATPSTVSSGTSTIRESTSSAISATSSAILATSVPASASTQQPSTSSASISVVTNSASPSTPAGGGSSLSGAAKVGVGVGVGVGTVALIGVAALLSLRFRRWRRQETIGQGQMQEAKILGEPYEIGSSNSDGRAAELPGMAQRFELEGDWQGSELEESRNGTRGRAELPPGS